MTNRKDTGETFYQGSSRSPDLPKRMPKFTGGYHFITIVTNNRIEVFKCKAIAHSASETLKFYSKRGDYKLFGYVIMPDHVHLILGVSDRKNRDYPEGIQNRQRVEKGFLNSRTISEIVRDIKKYIAKEAIKYLSKNDSDLLSKIRLLKPLKKRHFYQIWQPDFYDFNILNETKLNEKLMYMYENPLRKGLCKSLIDYEFSDADRYFGSGDPKLP